MVRGISLVAVAALSLAACNSPLAARGAELSYGQVQAIQPGVTAAQILETFGEPSRRQVEPDGSVRVLDYAAQDGKGNRARLVLGFDDRGVLVTKRFTGQVVKP